MSSGAIVNLNIGGTKFETSKSTLMKFDGMFKTMLAKMFPLKTYSPIFIDRDPRHFHVILNFMRDGDVKLPDSVQELEEIRKESIFYQLTGLMDMCNMNIRKIAKKNAFFHEDIQVIDTDAQLLQVVAKSSKPVLIIYFPTSVGGRIIFPRGFDMEPVLEHYKYELNVFFKSYSEDLPGVPAKPSPWSWSIHLGPIHSYGPEIKEDEYWSPELMSDVHRFFARNFLTF